MKKIVLCLVLLLSLGTVAVASDVQVIHKGNVESKNEYIWYRFHFGLNSGENAVSQADFNKFLETKIVPIISDGFTLTNSQGMMVINDEIVRENTVVIDIYTQASQEFTDKINKMATEYVNTFEKNKVVVFLVETKDIASTLWAK